MFDDIIEVASANYTSNDKAQMTIAHNGMKEELFIHLQDLGNINGTSIMDRFAKVLNSNEEMRVDESFRVHIGLLKPTKGGGKPSGKSLPLHPHLNNTPYSSIINKKAIVEIICEGNEYVCAAKSIVVCLAKLDNMPRNSFANLTRKTRQSRLGKNCLRTKAINLQLKTGLSLNSPVTVQQLALFESVIKAKIVVIQFVPDTNEPCITECSNITNEKVIFLYFSDNHFHAVVNPNAMFPRKTICMKCFGAYSIYDKSHLCVPIPCMVCERSKCEKGDRIICPDCNFSCRSRSCFFAHKEPKLPANNKQQE